MPAACRSRGCASAAPAAAGVISNDVNLQVAVVLSGKPFELGTSSLHTVLLMQQQLLSLCSLCMVYIILQVVAGCAVPFGWLCILCCLVCCQVMLQQCCACGTTDPSVNYCHINATKQSLWFKLYLVGSRRCPSLCICAHVSMLFGYSHRLLQVVG